jgi:hypothetical protein
MATVIIVKYPLDYLRGTFSFDVYPTQPASKAVRDVTVSVHTYNDGVPVSTGCGILLHFIFNND